MAEIKLANGQEVKELRVWNGVKWVAKRGRIFDGVKWIDFIRPPLTFKDDFITLEGMAIQPVPENVSTIREDKLFFNTLIRYRVN